MNQLKAALIPLVVALAGCAAGNRFDADNVTQLTPGVSTEQDAIRLIGTPFKIQTDPITRHQALVWTHVVGIGVPGVDSIQRLAIAFDANGRMIEVTIPPNH